MKTVLIGFAFVVMAGSSVAAHLATTQAWGLPGLLDEPVSVREDSVDGTRGTRGPRIVYFGSRRYRGGGYGYGK